MLHLATFRVLKRNADGPVIPDAEALQVVYDPARVTYRQLLEFFFKMHDPTTKNRQGPDVGSQYRSAVFYHDDEQEKVARTVTEKVSKEWFKGGKIATEVVGTSAMLISLFLCGCLYRFLVVNLLTPVGEWGMCRACAHLNGKTKG